MKTKIKIKESIYILREDENIYQVLFTSTRRIKRIRMNDLGKDLIEKIKTENNPDNIINQLEHKYKREDIESSIDQLETLGILRSYNGDALESRFSRQIFFIDELTDSWEQTLNIQNKLKNTAISVFGIGGIGTWIVNGLYQIGIGSLKLSDPDVVNRSNLNRQLYFSLEDVGSYKVDVIKRKIPNANIFVYKKILSSEEDLEEIIRGSDFLVNCADSPSIADTTKILDDYARKYNIPYCIAGGYNLHLGMVGPIIVPGKTACFDCFLEYQKENDPLKDLELVKDIEQTGSLGPIAGAVANLQVMEIFKYLINKGSINLNKFAEIDFMNFNVEWRKFSKREDCINCMGI